MRSLFRASVADFRLATLELNVPVLKPRMRLAKVDTSATPSLAARFGVRAIPTLVLLRDGHEVARVSGALDKGSLVRWVRERL